MDKNILISFGDGRIKQISEVLQNKTCNKILELLSEKDATVSDISGHLEIPMNTADYNVKKLILSGLIESSSHFWSIKGKKMPTYRISNKKIIISPRKTKGLTPLILALGFTGIMSLVIKKLLQTKEIAVNDAPSLLTRATEDVAFDAVQNFSVSNFVYSISGWEWFLIGAWLAILMFFIFSIIAERRKIKND
ncbi:MAG: helix-turn-helix domain-containing protein [Nanoarchaeota archaeon]|nr:helix-turn-helix domain-containing protein [Nanoarchaeota archaeon]